MTSAVGYLPPVIQRWLAACGAADRPVPVSAALSQHGSLRNSRWMPWLGFTAHQTLLFQQPGFTWQASVRVCGLPALLVRDRYLAGQAQTRVEFPWGPPQLSLKDWRLDQSALLRFMGEVCWVPMAAACPYLHWEEIDRHTARSTISFGGVEAIALWEFREDGLPARYSAKRYAAAGRDFQLLDWWVVTTAYAAFNGVLVGSDCEVYWRYPAGELCWLKLKVTGLECVSLPAASRSAPLHPLTEP